MSYYQNIYKKRVDFRGDTKKEIIVDMTTRQFLENLAESPNAENISLNGETVRAIITTNKSDQSKMSLNLFTAKDKVLSPGGLVRWSDEDWLVMSIDKFSAPAYNKGVIIRGNVRVKFYDSFENLVDIPGLFLGSLNSVLRESVYRQMGLAIELDDRRAMLVFSGEPLRNNSRVILDGRAWRIVDFDSTSNKTLVYASLQEDNLDPALDDIENGIGDAYLRAVWNISLPVASVELDIGDTYSLKPSIARDGVPQETDWTVDKDGSGFSLVDGVIVGEEEGAGTVTLSLKNNPNVKFTLFISVVEEGAQQTVAYELHGDATIRLGETKPYKVLSSDGGAQITLSNIAMTVTGENGETTNLATIKRQNTTTYNLTANESMKLGKVKINAFHDSNLVVSKIVEIRSLW